MKLAILCPIQRRIEGPGQGGVEGQIILLAGRLAATGVKVTLFAVEGSWSPGGMEAICPIELEKRPEEEWALWRASSLGSALGKLKEYDMVQNFQGLFAASFAGVTGIPWLTSLYDPPGRDGERVIRENPGASYFLWQGPGGLPFDLDNVFVIEPGEEDLSMCLKIYEKILSTRENHRPWGFYENLAEGPDHKLKRITVMPGQRLSLQKHARRAERWVVISGQALVTLEKEEVALRPGEAVDIPKGAWHRVKNPGAVPLVFAEVQLGDYFGEDDIIRLDDDYGRGG